MKGKICSIIVMISAMLILNACKKDDAGSGLKAVFSYVADGYKVNFTNFSTRAQTYLWDFGDGSGETSTNKSPQHIFTAKGDYLVSLTATNGTETNTFTDSVSIIGPNIKIDNDLTDWQYVGYTHVNRDEYEGTLRAVKTFASSTDVFFYLEGTADMGMALFDMYIDIDDNPATGYFTGIYPAGSGADVLAEGPAGSPSWGSIFVHSGAPADFTFSPVAGFDDAMKFSPLQTVSGKKVMEFSIKKSTLDAKGGAVNFAFIELTTGWAELGKIPEDGTAESKFIRVPL